MHHYTTVTWRTLPTPRQAGHVLRDDIPRLGLRFPYLMHQLLAVAALHIFEDMSPDSLKSTASGNNNNNKTTYLACASRHQSIAISGMRTALSKPITDSETSRALFATSAFLMIGTLAMNRGEPVRAGNLNMKLAPCPMDGILETFSVVRGMGAIRKLERNLVDDLFGSQPLDISCVDSLRLVQHQLRSLETRITMDNNGLSEAEKLTVCSEIRSLMAFMDGKSTATIMARKELSLVFAWPWTMSDDLLALLHARHPAALTKLLYYCIVMQSLETDYWFLHGWSSRLARVISMSLRGSMWEEVARWPLHLASGANLPLDKPDTF
ncbi:hypothetical protein B0T16DRAFT_227138 [Cercophora newfieldiana]|uniref:Uncharacterized protein n=1 Tax=Cercophora newfieldiana TaxID=92897 RepID=A0AA40CHF4_9PEZI|nr:hypothetical protein B0T16DRAFT_227138 [Cercophora newfieldiana]